MSIFRKLSEISRKRKIKLFIKTFNPNERTRVLDVGAVIDPNNSSTKQFIDLYPWKNRISVVNLSTEHITLIKKVYPEIEALSGDACELPWPDKHFDIVYCNAVIEHMGSFDKQEQLANEIMRVGKRWFVATPNRWYPFEFHMRLPLVTWLPCQVYLRAGRIFGYNHVRKKYMSGINYDDLRLMTARELRSCFPGSRIIKQRVTFMAETLVVIGGEKEVTQEARLIE